MITRRDLTPLHDILEATQAAETFLSGVGEAAFLRDELLQSAMAQLLFVVGEASTHLSSAARAGAPGVDWRALVSVRDLVVQPGAQIDWSLVWKTAVRDLPEIGRKVRDLLAGVP